MDSKEAAAKLVSACNFCYRERCPFVKECGGTNGACKMKEVAMILRAQDARILSLETDRRALMDLVKVLNDYVSDVEKVNSQYFELCKAFQMGYRGNKKILRRVPPLLSRKRKKKIDVHDMDGDPRYEFDPDPPKQEKIPEVVI